MSNFTPGEAMHNLHRFVTDQLPTLNNSIIGRDMPEAFLAAAKPVCEEIAAVVEQADDRTAPQMLQETAFIASSAERHQQSAGGVPGQAVAALGLGPVLITLGRRLDHVPRDSHETYWLKNRGPARLTFTGDAQEHLFAASVIRTQDLHLASAMALRPICDGDVDLNARWAAEALRFVTANFDSLTEDYKNFMTPAADRPGQWKLTPEFFTTVMRTYLLAYSVGGTSFTGPNATNIPGQLCIDFLIGAVDENYSEVARKRMVHLNAADRSMVERDQQRRSIVAVLLENLHLSYHKVLEISEEQLADILIARKAVKATASVTALATASARLSAVHFSLLHNFLRKPIPGLTGEAMAKLPVPPTHGVGNATHDETKRIMEMRRDPAVTKLVNALRTMPTHGKTEAA